MKATTFGGRTADRPYPGVGSGVLPGTTVARSRRFTLRLPFHAGGHRTMATWWAFPSLSVSYGNGVAPPQAQNALSGSLGQSARTTEASNIS